MVRILSGITPKMASLTATCLLIKNHSCGTDILALKQNHAYTSVSFWWSPLFFLSSHGTYIWIFGSILVSEQIRTYPTPNLKLTLTCYQLDWLFWTNNNNNFIFFFFSPQNIQERKIYNNSTENDRGAASWKKRCLNV